jgi:hypothetical protein
MKIDTHNNGTVDWFGNDTHQIEKEIFIYISSNNIIDNEDAFNTFVANYPNPVADFYKEKYFIF